MMNENNQDNRDNSEKTIGRNEPCPCGSGKKYKRCCGVNAAPKLGAPRAMPGFGAGFGEGEAPEGFDPSAFDPEMIMKFSQALQQLPKGQMQRLQSLMQKAMAGKDVSREAAEFEQSLPPGFREMMASFQTLGQTPVQMPGEMPSDPMAGEMLPDGMPGQAPETQSESKLSKMWKGFIGKKDK